MRKKAGFTLIEIIIVVIIIGILASTILPRFVDLSSSAQSSVMKNISASLSTAIRFVLLKDNINGAPGGPVDYNGNSITFTAGLPTPSATEMRYLLEMDLPSTTWTPNWEDIPCADSDFCIVGNLNFNRGDIPTIPGFTSGTGVFFWPEGSVLAECYAYYINLGIEGSDPVIGHVTTGC